MARASPRPMHRCSIKAVLKSSSCIAPAAGGTVTGYREEVAHSGRDSLLTGTRPIRATTNWADLALAASLVQGFSSLVRKLPRHRREARWPGTTSGSSLFRPDSLFD
jgi:hypothetical protein